MRRANLLLLIGLVAAVGWATGAQDEPVKVGVVDVDQAISSTERGKKAREEFQRKQEEAQKAVRPLIEKYKELQKEIKSKKYVLSDDALFDKQVKLAELRNRIDNKIQEVKGQLKIDQGRLEAPLRDRLRDIVSTIGKEEGFTLILMRDSPGVMYSREALDITDAVVERFNEG